MSYLTEINQLLRAMEFEGKRVNQYMRRYDNWVAMVLAYPEGWKGTYPNFESGNMDLLESLIDTLQEYTPECPEAERSSLGDVIDEVLEALRTETDLPPELKAHLYTVAAHARRCLDDYEIMGDFALKIATDRLYADLARAAEVAGVDSKWGDRFRRAWTNHALPIALTVGSGVAGEVVLAAITG